MDRRELADFLRRRREQLRPADVGLAAGMRRRTPGLRREEVAQLAGVSADYCMRLEQQRSSQPSTQVLAALARALRLTADERDHLYVLAGHPAPAGRLAGDHVRPGLGKDHVGIAAIRDWAAAISTTYQLERTVLETRRTGAATMVLVRVAGNFPGSPVDLHHHFTDSGDRIAALTICP